MIQRSNKTTRRRPDAGTRRKQTAKAGRPAGSGRYHVGMVAQARIACAEMGATNDQLAKFFGVSRKSVQEWLREHQAFREAVQAGRDAFNSAELEATTLQRATGYDYTERTEELRGRGKNAKLITVKTVRRHVPADTSAAIFWLCNRSPARWKQSSKVELGGADGKPLQIVMFQGDRKTGNPKPETRNPAGGTK